MRDQPGPPRPGDSVLVPRRTRAGSRWDLRIVHQRTCTYRDGLDGGADVAASDRGRNAGRQRQLLLRADGRGARLRQRARHQRRAPRRHAAREQEHSAAAARAALSASVD